MSLLLPVAAQNIAFVGYMRTVVKDSQPVSTKRRVQKPCMGHIASWNRLCLTCRDDKLDELQTFEFTLPEDIERMKNERRKGSMTIDTLDLMDEAVCTPSSIEVAWRPPTKNADRISKFKLMLATTTGVVKDVYQGLQTRYKSTGLRPDMEYIFCVKATYDDGSFLWSESKAFRSRA